MRSLIFYAGVALFAAFAFLEGTRGTEIKRDFSELTSTERIILRLTRPEVYKTWSARDNEGKTRGLTSSYGDYDFLFFHVPMFHLLMVNLENIRLPNLHFEIGFYWCWIGCTGFQDTYDWVDPVIKNANLTKLSTKVNATNVEIEFQIPDFQLVSENYYQRNEDLVSGDVEEYRGNSIIVTNYTLKVSANLEFVPDVGLQVSNLEMNFGVEEMKNRRENATRTFPDGNVEDLGVVEDHVEEELNADWAEHGENITATAEIWLNCFLSNGRNGRTECNQLIGVEDRLQTENFVQLLQAIGLDIARNAEEVAKNSIATVAKDNSLPLLLLPQFPFPSIKSILLDFPPLLLQLGRVVSLWAEVGEGDYFDMPYLPMSYDFVRENCSLGECRKIHEHMTLPQFGIGSAGFKNSTLDLDIQPANFMYYYKLPYAYLDSVRLQHETTDVETGFREFYLGLNLTIQDAEFGISGGYELKEDVGLQVSNISLTLSIDQLQMSFPQYFTTHNGEESEIVEYKVDIASQIMEIWQSVDEDGVSLKRKYEENFQNAINAYLSGQSL